jgi:TetR/AcrR family transcriptional repressor of nem operon
MMIRTAQENSPTKDRLLDAAEQLMLTQGFTATTVDEICEAAKLTKGSFFHYFESKDQLGKEVLLRFCEASQRLHQSSCCQETDPLKRVYSYVDFAIKMANNPEMRQGCLLGTLAQELSDTHPEIRSVCAKGFSRWADLMRQDLAAAKAQYAPKSTFDPEGLAQHFIAVLEGSFILAKAQQDSALVEKSLRHFRAYLGMLFEDR